MSNTGITYDYQEILKRLSAFFPANQIKSFPLTYKRDKTAAMAAFYITNRGVQQRLDDTCVWRNKFVADPRDSLGKSIICTIEIKVQIPGGLGFEWIGREDGAENSDIEDIKGGLSNAMRRSAVQWGIGRYLYEVEGQWTPMKVDGPKNKSGNPLYFKTTPRMPSAFLPSGSGAQRAQSVASQPETPASTTKAEAAKKAFKLTPAQTKKYAAAKKGKDLKKVAAVYETVITQTITVAEGLTKIVALPDVK